MTTSMYEYLNSKSLSGKFSSIKWKHIFYSVGLSLIIITIIVSVHVTPTEKKILNLISNEKPLKKHSFLSNSVPMPCVQPHCDIECIDIYENSTKDGIIDGASLSRIQHQHLMIDMNNDQLINDWINSIPPPKICPYRQRINSLLMPNSSMTINFYPLVFGFVDHYLLKTLSREVLLDKKFYKIDQICLPKKSKDFNEIIPGRRETYKFRFEDELDYRRIYSASYFSITMKKAGWDCNRHYEIISTGSMPYFDKLDQVGNYTLSHLPKSLLYDVQTLPGVNRPNLTIDHQLFNVSQYYLLLHRLLYYAKHRLTTIKIVEYILNVIQYSMKPSKKHSILFISHYKSDYMKDFLLHGFTRIFGDNLHVFQPPQYMYDYPISKMWTNEETKNYYKDGLYGYGYGYKLTLKNYIHLYQRDIKDLSTESIVQNNIQNQKYSLIVFGSILRENNLFPFVTQYYSQSKIILIDGEDEHWDIRRSEYAKNAFYFLREIPNNCNQFM